METKTEEKVALLDEFDIASHTSSSIEEARDMMRLTGKSYECNGVYYVKTSMISLGDFSEALKKEAIAFLKRSKVFEFIDDHQGCIRKDIQTYMEENTSVKLSYDAIDLMLTILTEETEDLYEDDDDRLFTK